MTFRAIATYLCKACGHKWLGPHLIKVMTCPHCHLEQGIVEEGSEHREEAPRI